MANLEDTYEEKLGLTKDLLEVYEYLLETISHYHFRVTSIRKNTVGAKQNAITEEILGELDNIKPVFVKSLHNIDQYLENDDKLSKDYEEEVIQSMNHLIDLLYDSKRDMENSQEDYYKVWSEANHTENYQERTKEINHALGVAKSNWKKQRNASLHAMLETFKKVREIDRKIAVKEERAEEWEDTYKLDRAIKRIEKGPFYYCFLNEEEKEALRHPNNNPEEDAKKIK